MPTVTLSNGRRFEAERGMSVLDAGLAQGVTLAYSCRTGRCGSCKVHVAAGESRALQDESSLNADELNDGWVLTCAREAVGDLVLDVEDLSALAGIVTKMLPCRVDSLDLLAPDVMKVTLRLPPAANFAFLPGQYVELIGPGGLKRSYSIASAVSQPEKIELHVKRYDGGAMSAYWFLQARPNDLLRFRGPSGTFFLRDIVGRDLVFLATGTGYAPIRSMLAQLAQAGCPQPRSIGLYWGGRERRDLYADPVSLLSHLRFTPVLSRPDASWGGARGHVQNVLLADRCDLRNAVVYACGSDAMVKSARAVLVAAGVPARRYFADAFVCAVPFSST